MPNLSSGVENPTTDPTISFDDLPVKESPTQGKAEEDNPPSTWRDKIIKLIEADAPDLFHAPDGAEYATFMQSGVMQTARIRSGTFGNYLRQRCYSEMDRMPPSQSLQEARDMLAAKAVFGGEEREVYLRVAHHNARVYVDLCNDRWQVIEITQSGWTVKNAEDVPVRFRRAGGMKPLPTPDQSGDLSRLEKYIPLKEKDDFALIYAFLVAAAWPEGPYPVLVLVGEHGTGKSTVCEMIRTVFDPSRVPVRARPRDERDLIIAATNAWCLVFDNLSGIHPWLSDAFCRLSTGGGFGTRQLYTDSEEQLFFSMRPLILNGIDDVATRGDLADRSIIIRLDSIPDDERKTRRDLSEAFESDMPIIFGGLLDALVTALARIDSVRLDRLPRMADFAKIVTAAEPALPIEPGAFMRAYAENRQSASEDTVTNDTVAAAIVELLDDEKRADAGEWTGKTKELLDVLKPYLSDSERPPRDYPGSHQALTSHLRRIMPPLRVVGIEREDDPRKKSAIFTLRMIKISGGEPTPPTPPTPAPERKPRVLPAETNTHQHPATPPSTPAVPERNGVEGVEGVGQPPTISIRVGDAVSRRIDGVSCGVIEVEDARALVKANGEDRGWVALGELIPEQADPKSDDDEGAPF